MNRFIGDGHLEDMIMGDSRLVVLVLKQDRSKIKNQTVNVETTEYISLSFSASGLTPHSSKVHAC